MWRRITAYALFILGYTPSVKDQTAMRQLRQMIGELKTSGEKIKVDFKDCEIREHSYSERGEPYGSDSLLLSFTAVPRIHELLNELEDETRGTGIANVCQSVIIFHYPNARTGQTKKFMSRVISKDRITLSFYLDKQRQTTIYVNKTDRSIHYFDLDFLSARSSG